MDIPNTVRNNIFHGGKFPFVPERDEQLIYSSLIIIDDCIESVSKLKKHFLETAE
ncbi:MAG: hypothetical protein HZA77_08800 [Candidatus Schekmanbacteria bacterium]|nr:hypothetical protein [Candidatus Schekmanbacteria bacterium]